LQPHNLLPLHWREDHACFKAEEPKACPGSERKENAYIASKASEALASPLEIESLGQSVFNILADLMIVTWRSSSMCMWLVRIHPSAERNARTVRHLTSLAKFSGYTGIAFTCSAAEYFDSRCAWKSDPNKFGSLVVQELKRMSEMYERAEKTAAKFTLI
jgi:hypothetical protein